MEKELTAHLKCWLPHGEGAHGPSEVHGFLMEKEFMAHLRCWLPHGEGAHGPSEVCGFLMGRKSLWPI